MATETFDSLDALPATARALLDGADGVFSTAAWYRAVVDHALPASGCPQFLVWSQAGHKAVVPLLTQPAGLSGLTTPYTCSYRPCASAGMDDEAWRGLGRALGRHARGWGHVRIDALDEQAPWLLPLIAGLRAGGLMVRRFAGFGNWGEPVAGSDWASYLARRPGPLRETIRRKAIRARGRLRFEIVAGGPALEPGIAAYADVYARSWKQPEPFATFPAAMMRAMAGLGVLRLGLCWKGPVCIAAQIWTLEHGRATIHKLAHDEADRADSPGTLLMAEVLRPMLDDGSVSALDFGRGDDSYKRSWAGERRQRIGLLAINPRRAAGMMLLARQTLGAAVRAVRSVQPERGPGEHDPKTR